MARSITRAFALGVPVRSAGVHRPSPVTLAPAHVVSLRFALPRPCSADVHVLGPLGRRVRTIASGELEAGEHRCGWDGLDDTGRRCEAGCYVLRLELSGRLLTSRIVALA